MRSTPRVTANHTYTLPMWLWMKCPCNLQSFRVYKRRNGHQCLGALTHAHNYADACNCTRGLYGHRKRVCTENWLGENSPLQHRRLQPAAVLPLAFQSNALYPLSYFRSKSVCSRLMSSWRWPEQRSKLAWERKRCACFTCLIWLFCRYS